MTGRELTSEADRSFDEMWATLARIGRDRRSGGYRRFAWTPVDWELREWFTKEAHRRDLAVETDGNGNLWAWWRPPSAPDHVPAVVTGSHLDSVPDGGAYDGPLGVVSAFAAIDALRHRGVMPRRPIGVVCFAEEEGARFGAPCLGSRLLTGAIDAERARALVDGDGTTLAEALRRAGHDPAALGTDGDRLRRIGFFVELHIEQGRGLVELDSPIALGEAIWPHGRWRFDFAGRADHAGTTRMEDREDPMLPFARTALAASAAALRHGAVATFGKIRVTPNGTNAIPSLVQAWLDARARDAEVVRALVAELTDQSEAAVCPESWTPAVTFDAALRDRLAGALGGVPILPTGAGHDAGVLASAGVPTAMVFVRNPTGISHSPAEHAEPADCHAGVAALATVLRELA